MTLQTSVTFASVKRGRVPLAEIDVRDAEAARKLDRVRPAGADRSARMSTFNSAL
ncbi:FxSxx-COOH cyclophane-containing RiPP peptide [Streptomyces tirandamycinicus]|uniref:FxSxx-COOH cyclophane-containing RiPP peptide n=1 Tax=Streptomyces tirandamycinicus TaxID=2174846 RepID=UPI00342AD42E